MTSLENEVQDFDNLRKKMVTHQLISRGIRDRVVLRAMEKVPRHLFTPSEYMNEAYEDHPLPIGFGQTISQPYMVALMTELLVLKGREKVLEVGTGSGYQTAVLLETGSEVYSIERHAALAESARRVLASLGYERINIYSGDGTKGLPEYAPFDRIIVTAAAQTVPSPLVEQLNENGILVIPVGERFSQDLLQLEKKKGKITRRTVCGCVFVPLISNNESGEIK